MGTRNLTMVIDRAGKLKVAQYGQWDGYPSGQGATILKFAKDKEKMAKLEKRLNSVRFYNKNKKLLDYFDELDNKTREWSDRDNYWFRALKTRDLGSSILDSIINVDLSALPEIMNKKIYLYDDNEFGQDSLFCEWAYCINLQTNKLECFMGFNQDKSKEHPRFATKQEEVNKQCSCIGTKYYGIVLIKEYSLSKLPSKERFIKELEKEEEE